MRHGGDDKYFKAKPPGGPPVFVVSDTYRRFCRPGRPRMEPAEARFIWEILFFTEYSFGGRVHF